MTYVEKARAYAEGGASAISCLTEPRHFGGSPEALRAVATSAYQPSGVPGGTEPASTTQSASGVSAECA